MENWIGVFVMIVAISAVAQAALLLGMFLSLRATKTRVEQLTEDLHARVSPTLIAIQSLIEETKPHIASIVADAAEMTGLARGQVQHADGVLNEGLERLRLQLIRTDQIVTGALNTVEHTGEQLKRSVLGPVQSVFAVVRGIQTGVEFFRNRREAPSRVPEPAPESQDESLFI